MFRKRPTPPPAPPAKESENLETPSNEEATQATESISKQHQESGSASDAESQLPVSLANDAEQGNALETVEYTHDIASSQATQAAAQNIPSPKDEQDYPSLVYTDKKLETVDFKNEKYAVMADLIDKIDYRVIEKLSKEERLSKIEDAVTKRIEEITTPLTSAQLALLKSQVIDEIIGFGPLEPLIADSDISDIMINTAKNVYVEKRGKIYLSDLQFNDERHLLNTIQKIVSQVGRSVDESNPMVDARMPDGSRFNAIIPPLALDGSLVSIRKFKKNKMPLRDYVNYESMDKRMCTFLEICGAIRLNIIVSGGTGSGKTTLLNALSGHIEAGERVITIEDAAELQLHQPHVLRLETRPPSTEGKGEITQRLLVKNALRMRPDRIILGEIRSDEVIDVLSAMNTGHDGSMATIHANSPRDCLARIENLVGMSGIQIGLQSLRHQIASAVNVIVQIARMRDGKRRITKIEEVVRLEGDTIVTQTIFEYKSTGMDADGNLIGEFQCMGIRPTFTSQAEYFNRDKELLACITNR
jgi:pilus assembly protein CpaF